jgi:hypothetical protein
VSKSTRRRIALTVATALIGTGVLAPAAGATEPSTSVVAWNAIAQRAAVAVGKQAPAEATVTLAQVQAAVYDATVAIDGGRPYAVRVREPWRHHASLDAAVATAAHDMLVHLFPGQAAALDADYATALAGVPGGRAKDTGIAVGDSAGAGTIALRQGDGYQADIGFVMPSAAPGVFQLPAGQVPVTPWVSRMRPFLMDRPDQFRPDAPPALSSPEYARDFNEVVATGGATSTVRTAEQSTIARFWTTNAAQQFNTAVGQLALSRGLDADQAARLFAMVDMFGADAQIGCYDAKYHYLFWRPQFAVPLAGTDGNPDTTPDATWKPFVSTPAHPEYPSAHSCLSMASADAIGAFLGTRQIELDLRSTVTTDTMPTRHYATVDDLIEEVQNARVWGGIHYRTSTATGAQLGDRVARWDLRHGPFRTSHDGWGHDR